MPPVDPNQLSQDKDFLAAVPADQIKYLSAQDPDFAKAAPGDQYGYLSHLTGKSIAPPVKAVPTTQADIDRTLGPPSTIEQFVQNPISMPETMGALKGLANNTWGLIKNTPAAIGEGMIPLVKELARNVPQIPGAIRDINASPDPLAHYAQVASDTASQGAPQALLAAATDAAASRAPQLVQAAKNYFTEPSANLVEGMYSKPGSQIAASLRGSSRFDVPAAAANAHPAISEGLADRGITAADFKGRNGPAALQAGIDNALDIHEARAKQVIDPIRDQEVDPSVLNENPQLKARFSPEQIKNGLTYGDLDNERIQLNKDLRRANFYSKDPSAQYAVADPLADAHDAADQARNLVYGKAEEVTGQNLRPLKQTESNLIKLGDLAETTKNGLSAGAAQSETASPLAKGVNAVKKVIAIKKNPASSLASLANSPETLDLDGFNSNMRKAFGDVKAAPGSVLKNGKLLEPGPAVLTSPNGVTPPAIQPRQAALPLTSTYAPMGENAGLTSTIPGEQIPGKNLALTPPPPGEVGPTPLQNLIDFSKEAHPEDWRLLGPSSKAPTSLLPAAPESGVPRSLGAAASEPTASSLPAPLRDYLGMERRSSPRVAPLSAKDLEEAIKLRKPVKTPFDDTEGSAQTVARDRMMPELPGPTKPTLGANGEVQWPDSYKNPPKGGGGNYTKSDLDLLKEKLGMGQGGHAGNGVASVEELARPGQNYAVSKTGKLTFHGKSFAPESTPAGSAHVTVAPNGEFLVNDGTLSPLMERALKEAIKK